MKTYFTMTVAATLLTMGPLIGNADAKSKHPRNDSGKRIYSEPDRSGWYPRRADELKFGSKIWFEQMEAEGRFGGRRSAR